MAAVPRLEVDVNLLSYKYNTHKHLHFERFPCYRDFISLCTVYNFMTNFRK